MGIFGKDKNKEPQEKKILEEILKAEIINRELLQRILDSLKLGISATLTFTVWKGVLIMASSVTLISAGAQTQAILQEWTGPNGTGSQVPPVGPVTYTSDNPAVAKVDPSSGVVTAVANGIANIIGTDAGNNLSASGPVTVDISSAPVAVSATIDFEPVVAAQAAAQKA